MARIVVILIALVFSTSTSSAQTKEQWIDLGTRIHGGFGVLIPLGIKIGLDARERLKAEPRGITVHYYTGERAPCPCVADGVMLATQASPGQGTLVIVPEKAAPGLFASIVIRDRKTVEGFRYNIPGDLGPKFIEWNKSLDPAARYDVIMNGDKLFDVTPEPKSN
jgi:formylmethanofuran dehydrogenase subunit E